MEYTFLTDKPLPSFLHTVYSAATPQKKLFLGYLMGYFRRHEYGVKIKWCLYSYFVNLLALHEEL